MNDRLYQNSHILLVIKMMIYSIKRMKLTGHLTKADVRHNETCMASFHEFNTRLKKILKWNRKKAQHALNARKHHKVLDPHSNFAIKGNIIADLNQINESGIGTPDDHLQVIRSLSEDTLAMLTSDLKEFKTLQERYITGSTTSQK